MRTGVKDVGTRAAALAVLGILTFLFLL